MELGIYVGIEVLPRRRKSLPLDSASWNAICMAVLFEEGVLVHLPSAQSPDQLDGC